MTESSRKKILFLAGNKETKYKTPLNVIIKQNNFQSLIPKIEANSSIDGISKTSSNLNLYNRKISIKKHPSVLSANVKSKAFTSIRPRLILKPGESKEFLSNVNNNSKESLLPKISNTPPSQIPYTLNNFTNTESDIIENFNKTYQKLLTCGQNENSCNTSNNINTDNDSCFLRKNTNSYNLSRESPKKRYSENKTFTEKIKGNYKQFKIPNYPRVKYSKCPIGNYIKSFAVNSYSGINKQSNEIKVSIILNIIKPKEFIGDWPQCSFLAIFNGINGSHCSTFLRDHLHIFIIKNKFFPNDPERALLYGLEKAEDEFKNKNVLKGNNKSTSSSIVALIINNIIYIANNGNSHAIISSNNGRQIQEVNTEIEKIIINKKIDFLIMCSNSIVTLQRKEDCCNIAWKIMNNKGKREKDNIHALSGEIVDKIIKHAIKKGQMDNLTALFVGFENFEKRYNDGCFILKSGQRMLSLRYRNMQTFQLTHNGQNE